MSSSFSYFNAEGKPRLAFYDRGPGPAGVMLPPLIARHPILDPFFHAPTHRINPEVTMGDKLPPPFHPIGPGPAAYSIEKGLKSNGKFLGYDCTIREKWPLLDKRGQGPGPATYVIPPPEIIKPKAPAFVFGSRTPLYNKRVGPGPNVYLLPPAIGPVIPDKLAAQACTFKGDRDFKERALGPSPGPYTYNIGRPDLVKPRAPAYTMREKWPYHEKTYLAGPASYEVKFPKCPCDYPLRGAHMGIRYNEFTGVFLTPCDKSPYLAD